MLSFFVVSSLLLIAPLSSWPVKHIEMHEKYIDQKRECLNRETIIVYEQMRWNIRYAEYQANRIADVDIRNAATEAIETAIARLPVSPFYGLLLTDTLKSLDNVTSDLHGHVIAARRYVLEARMFGVIYDDLQEQLLGLPNTKQQRKYNDSRKR